MSAGGQDFYICVTAVLNVSQPHHILLLPGTLMQLILEETAHFRTKLIFNSVRDTNKPQAFAFQIKQMYLYLNYVLYNGEKSVFYFVLNQLFTCQMYFTGLICIVNHKSIKSFITKCIKLKTKIESAHSTA